MKYKWDNQNVLDYAREEGKQQGKLEEAREIARTFKKMGLPLKDIAKRYRLIYRRNRKTLTLNAIEPYKKWPE